MNFRSGFRPWAAGILSAALVAALSPSALALAPQAPSNQPQTRPAPRPGQVNRPNPLRPGSPGNGPNRPQPGRPNPGNGGNRPARPQSQPPRPNPPNRPQPPRPSNGNRPGTSGNYHFRPNDRDHLRRYYQRNLGYINRSRRPRFLIGGYIPFGDRGYFTPIPPPLLGYLPPPPPGYSIGYFEGYCVVYDPVTFAILNLVDLLS